MALMVTLDDPNITPEMYDAARAAIDWDHGPPAGCLLHMASFDETGVHCVDIWESESDLRAYIANRFEPLLRSLGFPEVTPVIKELRTVAVSPSIEEYFIEAPALQLAPGIQHIQQGVSRHV